jgi:hypothetical protein
MRITTLWILLIALALPLACSRAQETADEAASAAGEAAEAVAAAAADAKQATVDLAGAAGDAVEDPVAKCRELADQGAWSEALDVCTKAHQAEPDDMAIEHALQQAKAAAAE